MAKKIKLTKEIVNKVMQLDCSNEDNIRRLEKSLMRLPFIKKESDLEADRVEEMIKKIESRYEIQLSYLMKYNHGTIHTWSGMLRGRGNAWVTTVYGINLKETIQKALFYMYYHIEEEKEKESG